MSDEEIFDGRNRIVVIFTGLMNQEYKEVMVDANQMISQAVETFGFHSTESVLPVVNGYMENWDYILKDGDRLHLVQVISGG